MKKINLKVISRTQTNRFYDPARTCNGGGYCQPYYVFVFSDGSVLTVADDSCGDFGSDMCITVTSASGCRFVGAVCADTEQSAAFPASLADLFEAMDLDVYQFADGIMPDVWPIQSFGREAIARANPDADINDGETYFAIIDNG